MYLITFFFIGEKVTLIIYSIFTCLFWLNLVEETWPAKGGKCYGNEERDEEIQDYTEFIRDLRTEALF